MSNGLKISKIKLNTFTSKSDQFPPRLFAFFSKTKNIAKLKGLLHIQDAQDLAQDDKYAEMLRLSLQINISKIQA